MNIYLLALAIATSAAFGAVVRLTLASALNSDDADGVPTGTAVANLTASLLLGLLVAADPGGSSAWTTAIAVGGLGALSTWSTLANEVAALARAEQGALACAYLLFSITAGSMLAWVGLQLGRALF